MRTMGRLRNVQEFEKIVLSYKDGSVDHASATSRASPTRTRKCAARRGSTARTPSRCRSASSRAPTPSTVVDRVLARLERIQATLPSDIKVKPTRDQSRFIRKSFEEIQLHLILGGVLAALVVFLFIRNLRVTIIAALAIPTSIIGTFAVMRPLDFTLNNMTMLALSLATGIVIDDAIVVLENIFRYIEEKGASPKQAAIEATAEIGLAVMATTLSLVVIFVPVAFMTGPGRPLLLQLRHHLGDGDHAVDVRLVHADAGAVRVVAAGGRREGRPRQEQGPRRLRLDRPEVRRDARVVAGAPAADARHRRRWSCRRPSSSTRTSARNWCPTTTRASSASTCGCRAARASTARSST